jgi:SHS2 domain-containing protein
MPYEFLDHTADIQLHSWSEVSFEDSLQQLAYALINYMTDRSTVDLKESYASVIEASSMERLVFKFLDDILYHFYVDCVAARIDIVRLLGEGEKWTLDYVGRGEPFDPSRHRIGCEVKAITFSNLHVQPEDAPYDVYVIVDI